MWNSSSRLIGGSFVFYLESLLGLFKAVTLIFRAPRGLFQETLYKHHVDCVGQIKAGKDHENEAGEEDQTGLVDALAQLREAETEDQLGDEAEGRLSLAHVARFHLLGEQ